MELYFEGLIHRYNLPKEYELVNTVDRVVFKRGTKSPRPTSLLIFIILIGNLADLFLRNWVTKSIFFNTYLKRTTKAPSLIGLKYSSIILYESEAYQGYC